MNVNEGPVALQHDDQTFIIYSASYCATADYKLGMLTYTGGDPLAAASWVKDPEPVFQRSDANGVYGPGHNGFFKSPDGTEDWIVYHANTGSERWLRQFAHDARPEIHVERRRHAQFRRPGRAGRGDRRAVRRQRHRDAAADGRTRLALSSPMPTLICAIKTSASV